VRGWRRWIFRVVSLAMIAMIGVLIQPASSWAEESLYEEAISAYLRRDLEKASTLLQLWIREHAEDESAQRILAQVEREKSVAQARAADLQRNISYLREERLRLQRELDALREKMEKANETSGASHESPLEDAPIPTRWIESSSEILVQEDTQDRSLDVQQQSEGVLVPGLQEELAKLALAESYGTQARLTGIWIDSEPEGCRLIRIELSDPRPFELDWHEDEHGLLLTVAGAQGEEKIQEFQDPYLQRIQIVSSQGKLGVDVRFHSKLSVEVRRENDAIELVLR